MKNMSPHNRRGALDHRGFTLIELMIVLVILGILGMTVGVYINTADAKLRSFAFNLGSRLKQAKFEAIKDGFNAYLDFNSGTSYTTGKGFAIWVDRNRDGSKDTNEILGDEVVFPAGVEIYNASGDTISGGPAESDGGPEGDAIGNGVNDTVPSGGDLRIRFTPGGTAESARVYVYASRTTAGGKEVAAGPWAIDVNTVGRIRLAEWKNGAWNVD